ncbi:hypothetical protein BGZ65_010351 [Modicella reniformis]|uniref:Uncharacterized protein n=1 Tax=Modicella reniformis TaxID=1440133 RepID=A0A9P6IQK1_9FUNG|nr:hypothetical protein BGZ65_010351 [Modicella reniformis]
MPSLLNLKLDGGLCLMTRLKDLQKLRIVSHSKHRLVAEDVSRHWIGCSRSRVSVATKSVDSAQPVPPAPPSVLDMKQERLAIAKVLELDEGWHRSKLPESRNRRRKQWRIQPHIRDSRNKQEQGHMKTQKSGMVLPQENPLESEDQFWPYLCSFVLGVDPEFLFVFSSGVDK